MKRMILLMTVMIVSVTAYSQCNLIEDKTSTSTKRQSWASPFAPKMSGTFSNVGDTYFIRVVVEIITPATIGKNDRLVFKFEDNTIISFAPDRMVTETFDLVWFYFSCVQVLTKEQLETFQTKKVTTIKLEHNKGVALRKINKKYQKRIMKAANCIL